jgi:hypothetical protein
VAIEDHGWIWATEDQRTVSLESERGAEREHKREHKRMNEREKEEEKKDRETGYSPTRAVDGSIQDPLSLTPSPGLTHPFGLNSFLALSSHFTFHISLNSMESWTLSTSVIQ